MMKGSWLHRLVTSYLFQFLLKHYIETHRQPVLGTKLPPDFFLYLKYSGVKVNTSRFLTKLPKTAFDYTDSNNYKSYYRFVQNRKHEWVRRPFSYISPVDYGEVYVPYYIGAAWDKRLISTEHTKEEWVKIKESLKDKEEVG